MMFDFNFTDFVLHDIVNIHFSTLLLAVGVLGFTFIGFVLKSRFVVRVFTTGFLAGLMYSVLYNMYKASITAWDIMAITTTAALCGYILSFMVPSRKASSVSNVTNT